MTIQNVINSFESDLSAIANRPLIKETIIDYILAIGCFLFMSFITGGLAVLFYLYGILRFFAKRFKVKKDIKGKRYGLLPVIVENNQVLAIRSKQIGTTLCAFVLQKKYNKLKEKILPIANDQAQALQLEKDSELKIIFARKSGFFMLYNQSKNTYVFFEENIYKTFC